MVQYFRNIWEATITILIGMRVTFGHLFVKNVTLQYPKEKRELPKGSRQQLFVNMDDCIGCFQCERACPVSCITIETIKAEKDEDLGETSNGKKKRMYVTRFDIDMAKCCYCADCVFPCPTDCIYMLPEYEFSTYDRSSLLFKFSDIPAEKVAELKAREAAKQAEAEANKPKPTN